MITNYYAVLGVSPGATIEEIKSAHRELMKQVHPDVADKSFAGLGEVHTVEEINMAYSVLKNSAEKTKYDALRKMVSRPCNACEGTGALPTYRKFVITGKKKCTTCNGTGEVNVTT